MFRFTLLVSFSCAWLVLLVAPADAILLAEAAVRTASVGGNFSAICQDGGSGSRSAIVNCSQAGNFGYGRADARYGSLETYAQIYSDLPPIDNESYQTYGRAYFSDRLVLGSSLLTPGVSTDMRVIFGISGSLVNDGPTWLEPGDMFIPWTFTVRINGLELQPSNGFLTLSGESWYDFNMPAGGEVTLSADLVSDVRCHGCDVPYNGIADFFGTVSVSSVEVLGLAPGDFEITSLEGASYANVVPEPNTAVLLATGLFGLAVKIRREREARVVTRAL